MCGWNCWAICLAAAKLIGQPRPSQRGVLYLALEQKTVAPEADEKWMAKSLHKSLADDGSATAEGNTCPDVVLSARRSEELAQHDLATEN